MSYAIFDIVYGIPLTEELANKIDEMEQDENSSWGEGDNGTTCGFKMLYTSSGPSAGYCGISLDQFDEATDCIKFSSLKSQPTALQLVEARKNLEALKEYPELWELAKNIPVDVYLVPYSS